jgi:hypothetical protein
VKNGVKGIASGATFLATAACLLVLAPASMAAPPAIQSFAESDAYPSLTWTLPASTQAFFVQIATSPATTSDGAFLSEKVVVGAFVKATDTAWTSASRLAGGTYYAHVQGLSSACSCQEWSETRALTIAARTPAISGVAVEDGFAVVSLSFGGLQPRRIEIAKSPATGADGAFVPDNVAQATWLESTQTSPWTSSDPLDPGTYYLHLSGMQTNCWNCALEVWSTVATVVVSDPPPPENTAPEIAKATFRRFGHPGATRVFEAVSFQVCDGTFGKLTAEVRETRSLHRRVRARGRFLRLIAATDGACRSYRLKWRVAPKLSRRGMYSIRLRVRDNEGAWSSFVAKTY